MDFIGIISLFVALYAIYVAKKTAKQSSADAMAIKQATKELTKSQLRTDLNKIQSQLATQEKDAVYYRKTIKELIAKIERDKNDPLCHQDIMRQYFDDSKSALVINKSQLSKLEDSIKELKSQEDFIQTQLSELEKEQ